MRSSISRFIKVFDFYKNSLYLSLKGTNTSKTFCGGIISIFLIFLFLVILFYLFIDVSNKQNQYYTQSNLRYASAPNFNFTSSIDIYKEQGIPFFFFALSFYTNMQKAISIEEINQYFYFETQLQFIKNATSTITNKYSVVLCDTNLSDSTGYLYLRSNNSEGSELNKKKILYYCLNETIYNVEGDFVLPIYRFLSIKLKDCKNNPNKNIICNTDKTQITNFIQDFNIDLIYSNYYVKKEILNDIPIEYFTKRNSIKISKILYQKIDYYLSYSEIETEENLFLNFLEKLSGNFINTPKVVKNYATLGSSYLALYFRSNYDYILIQRSYKTFLNLISQLGGIWKIILIIGVSIISKFNLKSMLNILGNSIYSVISRIKKKQVDDDENFSMYKTKGNEAFPNNIIVSNNKSDIEAELYIDIYKYERSRGLNISMKDMILQTYFTCLLKLEKKEIMILQEKIENEILMKLDFIKILMFIKQFKIFKSIIVQKKNFLMRINKMKTIQYKKVQYLIKSIQEEKKNMVVYSEEDEEKRIDREKIFLKGLRYFRNKPVFDKNIDVKIFNMFKWDKKIMGRYLTKNIKIKDHDKN